ncbi:MAG: GntR family transcriptional regulator [Planctomycetota bacterium]
MTPRLVTDPVYLQLANALRDAARDEGLKPGDRFFTEREISRRFGVSRATANKALSGLVAEGALEFRKGLGTFVRGRPLDYDLQSLVSFTDKARAAGKLPATRIVRFQCLPAAGADQKAIGRLGLGPDESVYYMERLRLANEMPVIFERRYVRAALCPGLTATDVSGSLYDLWTTRFGLQIAGAEERIHAVNLRGPDAGYLGVRAGTAGFLVTAVGYILPEQPLWWEQTLYRGDAYEFHNFVGPLRSASPAAGRLRSAQRDGP